MADGLGELDGVSINQICFFLLLFADGRNCSKIAIFQPSCIFETSKVKFDERMTSPLKYNCQDTLICHQPQI